MGRPSILVTNDDGVDAEGLETLADALEAIGDVDVVAPDSEQSGVSQKISLREPLRVRRHESTGFRSVTGTPADAVYVALNHLYDRAPDLCVSGINHGANLADDLNYSGTVAGAVEATLANVPSMAVSLAGTGDLDFDVAATFARRIAEEVLERRIPRDVFLNVNVPAGAAPDADVAMTNVGRRNYRRDVTEKTDPYGRPYYWLGGSELGFDDLPGSDCNAVGRGKVAVTPVQLDGTHYSFMREMQDWNLELESGDDG